MTPLSTTSDVIPLGMEVRRVKIRKHPVRCARGVGPGRLRGQVRRTTRRAGRLVPPR